jgi:tRNA pseudouridine32 synthase/23S rRNA pseudouridine746 synthase
VKAPLPLLEGVGPSTVILPTGAWTHVLEFLEARFPAITGAAWHSRMSRGRVVDGDGNPINAETPYCPGTCIYYYRELQDEVPIPFEAEVLYQDTHLLVADKPHFLPVMPSGRFLQQTLLVRLKRQFNLEHLVPLHRIDRGTAGIVVFSKDPQTRRHYHALFLKRKVLKIYEALAPTLPEIIFPLTHRSRMMTGEPFFRMQEVDGVPNTETWIEVAENRGALSLYRLQPLTGKKHQLRVHLASLGAPILNDTFYPVFEPDADDDFSRPLKLLARSLAFEDPVTGKQHSFVSRRSL